MKKSIIALMGLFTLVACSEDVYDEIDEQNKDAGMMAPPTFDDSNPGWIDLDAGPFINSGNGYQSPWDIWYRNHPFTPIYTFSNRGGGGHTSPLVLKIIPYVGLAYYDGINDGIYDDPYIAKHNAGNGFVANLNNGNYPTLFANNQEVGNLVPAEVIELDGSSLDESELTIASDPSTPEHLLANAGNKHLSGYNNNNEVFRFSGLTTQEEDLLRDYGKVFYYEVHVSERVSGAPLGVYNVQARNITLENPSANPFWDPIPGYTANVNGVALPNQVYYYFNPATGGLLNETDWGAPYPTAPGQAGYSCNSREVVIEMLHAHRRTFSGYLGQPWEIYVTMPIGSYLWQTSGPMLVVKPQ